MQFLMILVLFFSLVVAVFAVQNAVLVPVNFVTWHFETSLVFVILVATALGALIVGLIGLVNGIKQRWKLKSLESGNSKLRQELDELTSANSKLESTLSQLEEKLTQAQEMFSLQVSGGDPQDAERLKVLLANTTIDVVDEPITMVNLPEEHADEIRQGLGDCMGFYQLTVSARGVSLLVNSDYWQTVEAQYPSAETDSGWRAIILDQELKGTETTYLETILKAIGKELSAYIIIRAHSRYYLLAPEEDLAQAVQALQTLFDLV